MSDEPKPVSTSDILGIPRLPKGWADKFKSNQGGFNTLFFRVAAKPDNTALTITLTHPIEDEEGFQESCEQAFRHLKAADVLKPFLTPETYHQYDQFVSFYRINLNQANPDDGLRHSELAPGTAIRGTCVARFDKYGCAQENGEYTQIMTVDKDALTVLPAEACQKLRSYLEQQVSKGR